MPLSLSLDSRSRLSFLTTFLISLFLPFLYTLQESRACSTISIYARHQGQLLSFIIFIFFRCLPIHACVDLSYRYLDIRDLFPFRILGSRVASFLFLFIYSQIQRVETSLSLLPIFPRAALDTQSTKIFPSTLACAGTQEIIVRILRLLVASNISTTNKDFYLFYTYRIERALL